MPCDFSSSERAIWASTMRGSSIRERAKTHRGTGLVASFELCHGEIVVQTGAFRSGGQRRLIGPGGSGVVTLRESGAAILNWISRQRRPPAAGTLKTKKRMFS